MQKLIEQHEVILERRTLKEKIFSKSKITYQLDASPLFDGDDVPGSNIFARMRERFSRFHSISKHMQYNLEVGRQLHL